MHDPKFLMHLEAIDRHPLFQSVNKATYENLLTEDSFHYYEPGETILISISDFQLIVMLEGRIEGVLYNELTRQDQLLMVAHGELMGIEFLADYLGFSKMPVISQSIRIRALESCICARISKEILSVCWQVPQARDYLTQQLASRLQDLTVWLAEHSHETKKWGSSEPFVQQISDFMSSPAIMVDHQTTVSEAAQMMTEHQISSLVVMESGSLMGILTSNDIVHNVGKNSNRKDNNHQPRVFQWMTANPLTIQHDARYDEALTLFLQNNIKHLPVMENTVVRGMLTLSDLMRKRDRGVLQTLQKIEQIDVEQLPHVCLAIYDVLSGFIRDGIPIRHTTKIITSLYDRLFCQCIKLGLQSMKSKGFGSPPLPFCWLQMGSAGRAEQLMLTDQDHFLVYANPDSEADLEQIDHYFAELAAETVRFLEQARYEPCSGKMMANHAQWRGSVKQWRNRLKYWAHQATSDDLMNAFNFFSFRYVYGEKQVYDQFLQMLYSFIEPNGMFLFRLAMVVGQNPVAGLDRPIKSLFRLKGTMDFKKEILFPLQHSILILGLYHDIYEGTPLQKIERLVKKKVIRPTQADEINYAYDCLLRIRLERHWTAWQMDQPKPAALKLSQFNTREQNNLHQSIKIIRTLQNQMLANFGLK